MFAARRLIFTRSISCRASLGRTTTVLRLAVTADPKIGCRAACYSSWLDVNVTRGGVEPLLDLIKRGGGPMEVSALSRTLNPNATDAHGWTALHHAASYGKTQVAKHLIVDRSAALDMMTRDGETPLILAAKMRRRRVLPVLIESGAKLDLRDQTGRTALHYAAEG